MNTVKFLEIDRPTLNGTIYPRAVVEGAINLFLQRFKETSPTLPPKFPLYKKPTLEPVATDMVGLIDNVRIEDGYLMGEVGFLESFLKTAMDGNPEIKICIRPIGLGTVNKDTKVVDEGFKIIGMAVVSQEVPKIKVSLTDDCKFVVISVGEESVRLEDSQVRELVDEILEKKEHAKLIRNGYIARA